MSDLDDAIDQAFRKRDPKTDKMSAEVIPEALEAMHEKGSLNKQLVKSLPKLRHLVACLKQEPEP